MKRQVKLRMTIIKHASEVTGNISKTCRYFGISRKTFYKWSNRYKKHGEVGLCDQSNKPHTSPRTTPSDIVSKILYLRKTTGVSEKSGLKIRGKLKKRIGERRQR